MSSIEPHPHLGKVGTGPFDTGQCSGHCGIVSLSRQKVCSTALQWFFYFLEEGCLLPSVLWVQDLL